MEASTAALIEAAGEAGVRRVVMMSTFMLAPNFRAGILKPLALYYKGMNDDKRAGEEALKESRLDWTIVYATRLTDGERTGRERLVPVTEIVTPRNNVSRSDAAAFLLAQSTTTQRSAPAVADLGLICRGMATNAATRRGSDVPSARAAHTSARDSSLPSAIAVLRAFQSVLVWAA